MQHVGAKNAIVCVQFVNDDPAQISQQLLPGFMEGEDAGVQHVRCRDENVGQLFADLLAYMWLRVAVIDLGRQPTGEISQHGAQLLQLVLFEGLERKDVDRATRRIQQQVSDDRRIVDERLAGGGGGCHDDVLPLAQKPDPFLLMTP